MLDGVVCRDKEIVGECVSEYAVDLRGHGAIKAAKTGLDVGHTDAKFSGGERKSDGGIQVAEEKDPGRFSFAKTRVHPFQNFAGLWSGGAGPALTSHAGEGDTP